jgi:hypothetical protein
MCHLLNFIFTFRDEVGLSRFCWRDRHNIALCATYFEFAHLSYSPKVAVMTANTAESCPDEYDLCGCTALP